MEGYYGPMPSSLIPFFWAPGWNSVQAVNKFQNEIGGRCAAAIRAFACSSRRRQAALPYIDQHPGRLRDSDEASG